MFSSKLFGKRPRIPHRTLSSKPRSHPESQNSPVVIARQKIFLRRWEVGIRAAHLATQECDPTEDKMDFSCLSNVSSPRTERGEHAVHFTWQHRRRRLSTGSRSNDFRIERRLEAGRTWPGHGRQDGLPSD